MVMATRVVVHASVHIGMPDDMEGFGLAVNIKVEGVDELLLLLKHFFSSAHTVVRSPMEPKLKSLWPKLWPDSVH